MAQSNLLLPSSTKGNIVDNTKDMSNVKNTGKKVDKNSSFEKVLARTNKKKPPTLEDKKINMGWKKKVLKKENNLEEKKQLLIQDSPLLSILTGAFSFDTETMNKTKQPMITSNKSDFKHSIVEVITRNSLIKSIMDKGVNQVLSEEKLPADILKEIGFDKYQETEIIDAFGIAPNQSITMKQLLDQMGFDHELIQSELRILKDSVKMGDLSDYLVRAEKIQQKKSSTIVAPNLSQKGTENIKQNEKNHQSDLLRGTKSMQDPLIKGSYQKEGSSNKKGSLGNEYLISDLSDIRHQDGGHSLQSLNQEQHDRTSFIKLTKGHSLKVSSNEQMKAPTDIFTKNSTDIMQVASLVKKQDGHSLIDKPLNNVRSNNTDSSLFLTPTANESKAGSVANQTKTSEKMVSVNGLSTNKEVTPEQIAAKWAKSDKNDFRATVVDKENTGKVIHEPSQLSDINMGAETANFPSNKTESAVFQQDEVLLKGDRAENIKAMVDKIVEKAEYNIKSGGGAAKIQLKPDHLGKVIFNVDVDGKEVSLAVVTESKEVQKMLEEGMGRLKESLHNQNLQFKSINVKIENESTADNFERANQGFDRNQEKEARSFIYDETDDSVEKNNQRVLTDRTSSVRPEQHYRSVISRDRVSVRA